MELNQEKKKSPRPYIVFRRTVNKGQKRDRVSKKTGEITQLAAHKQNWRCELTDRKGELCTWATVGGMQQYVAKGYVPIELGEFEEFFRTKDMSSEMVQELVQVYQIFSRSVKEGNALEAAIRERDELAEKLAALEGASGSSAEALAAEKAKLEAEAAAKIDAEAKARKSLEEQNAKLLKELEEANKVVAEQKKVAAAEAKAAGK